MMKTCKNILFACCLFFGASTHPVSAQMEKEELQSGLLVRGKVFGFVIIEDWWITSITLGAEYRFAKHHSLGADYVFFKHRYEQEQYNDSLNPDSYDEYNEHNPRQGLLLDYRFYIEPEWIKNHAFTPYINLFYMFGKARINHEAEWQFLMNDVINQREKFYDLGALLGMRFCFDNERLGIDVGIGYARRYKTENVEYYVTGGPNRFVEGQRLEQDRFIMRVNLFCYLFAKQYTEAK